MAPKWGIYWRPFTKDDGDIRGAQAVTSMASRLLRQFLGWQQRHVICGWPNHPESTAPTRIGFDFLPDLAFWAGKNRFFQSKETQTWTWPKSNQNPGVTGFSTCPFVWICYTSHWKGPEGPDRFHPFKSDSEGGRGFCRSFLRGFRKIQTQTFLDNTQFPPMTS